MFGGLGNFAQLLKQAQQIGGRLQDVSEELRGRRVTGGAGAGMVEVDMNGLQEVLAVRIEPKLVSDGDRELIEDLVKSAVNDAVVKARQLHAEAMKSLAGGMDLPGFDAAISQLTGGVPPQTTP
ncbi:MAG: YbaB/EbfC family nucleoid-associated protein [Pirellulales bacterium]|nr:YbaB/EbfC family nucleoid-associated protein [Pirellulales bacterium]